MIFFTKISKNKRSTTFSLNLNDLSLLYLQAMNSKNITIELATKDDMPFVLELIQELATFEREPGAVDITVDDLINDGFGKQPLFTCFVARVNNIIEGMALVYFRYSTWKGKTLHLEDLVVRASKRGTGLGNALFKQVISYAKQEGVGRAEWVVLDWNTNAIKFYERSGATILKDWHLVQMNKEQLNNYTTN